MSELMILSHKFHFNFMLARQKLPYVHRNSLKIINHYSGRYVNASFKKEQEQGTLKST